MRKVVFGLAAASVVVLLAILPVAAHHELAAKFDMNKKVQLSGIVTSVDWANPHVHIFLNVKDASGSLNNWAVELESPVDLQHGGWKRDSIKPGDSLKIEGSPARDGSKQVWGGVTGGGSVAMADGKKVFTGANPLPPSAARLPAAPAAAAWHWPDGTPRLGPPQGQTGYWAKPSQYMLMQTGANVQTSMDGLLKNPADADKVAPFQPWARDLFKYRQANFLKDDPLFLSCLPTGGPRQFQTPYGVQFVEDRERKRIFVLVGGGDHNWRLIYLDGREQRGQQRGDLDNPLYYGRAVGKWDGPTLTIDTIGFNERFWFSNGGLPHTDHLHLIEKISRPDFYTLKYEVTIDDPGAYTANWTSSWTMQWIPGEELPIYYCQDNRQ
ncbi:MAG TPA: DUF6152 family protein [Terriglobia bacterium]|nr:DUF6152 family protein [Terriglobia bacterium]